MTRSRHTIRYLHEAKIDELVSEWKSRGYTVLRNPQIGDTKADLLVTRGDDTIVFEVKTADTLPRSRARISRLAQAVSRLPNATFRLVVANPPRDVSVEIDDLEVALTRYLEDNFPSDLDELSTHTFVESVTDVEISAVHVQRGQVRVEGTGTVEVKLQYGSSGDVKRGDGVINYDSFPLTFDVTLDSDLDVVDARVLDVDTSSF